MSFKDVLGSWLSLVFAGALAIMPISNALAAMISEFQPNPAGSDPATTSVEISGPPGENFAGFISSIEADFAPGTVDRRTAVSGTFDGNGLLVVSVPDFENPSFTIVLSSLAPTVGSTVTDATGFGVVYDAIGVPDSVADEANVLGATLGGVDFVFTGREPELIFRDASVGDLYAVNSQASGEIVALDGAILLGSEFDIDPTAAADTFGSINPSNLANITVPGLISELQPNPSGSDPATTSVEISGEPGMMFAGFVTSIEADIAPGTVDRRSEVSGTFDGNGLLVVTVPDFENPSFTAVLSSQAPPVGTVVTDASAFGEVFDALGVPDSVADEANVLGATFGGVDFTYTGDEPQLIFRAASVGDFYAVNDPPGAQVIAVDGTALAISEFDADPTISTFGSINPAPNTPPLISEFQPNPDGADPATTSVELSGAAGAAFSVIISSIEADTVPGTVDRRSEVSGTFDGNGLAVVSIPDFENPSFTLVLSSDAPPIGTTVFDATGFGTVYDAVGVPDGVADEANILGAVFGGVDFTFTGSEPELIFRDASVGDFYAVNDPNTGQVIALNGAIFLGSDFTPDATGAADTFGAINPTLGDGNGGGDGGGDGPALVKIHEIQGAGPSVAITTPVTVEAVVTALFTRDDLLDGFFAQEEDGDADADPATSEGIFIFCRGVCPAVAEGDVVTVTGTPEDFFGMSQIDAVAGSIVVSGSGGIVTPVVVDLPAAGSTTAEDTFESLEGMLVQFSDTLVVSDYFQLGRFGQVVLTESSRARQYTDANPPSVDGYQAFLADLATRRIILDDDNNDQNDVIADGPDEAYPYPDGGFSTTNSFRGGDTINGLTGVLHWSFAGSGGTDAWRVRPVASASYVFDSSNPRSVAAPDVGGRLTVTSFNVLNYFTTLNVRGADSAAELDAQRAKIVAALAAIDADVAGLIEIENDAGTATAQLVAGLNAATAPGTYAYIDTGVIGTDQIKVALIYKAATVLPLGSFAVLDASVDPTFLDTKNRPALAQTFEEIGTGEIFTVAVNHFKSKGSSCDDVGDPGLGDGQANCNQTRTDAAVALANWLATDPTSSGDEDFMILGDLNAYAMEDPITALQFAGYSDLLALFTGPQAYTFVFDGQLGNLDYALATDGLLSQVTGAAAWNINADEVNLLDYNDAVQDPGEQFFERKSTVPALFAADAFRSSDHDPVIVGLNLASAPPPLEPITDLAARAKSTKVQLSWSPVAGAVGYNVYRQAGNGAFELLAEGFVTDFGVYLDTIAAGVTYTYVVEWIDADGNVSPGSNAVTATVATRSRTRSRSR